MFEKEADEASNEKIKENYQLARCARKSYKDGFIDGTEFGYNKAKDDMMNRISFALKEPVLQMGFEVICSKLARLEKENADLKKQINDINK